MSYIEAALQVEAELVADLKEHQRRQLVITYNLREIIKNLECEMSDHIIKLGIAYKALNYIVGLDRLDHTAKEVLKSALAKISEVKS